MKSRSKTTAWSGHFLQLAYPTLWRFIQLLTLLARGDTAKDLEILVLRQQLPILRLQIP